MNLKTGDRIGDYEILGILGAGGMGSVFKVRNVISDRVEALKLLLPNLADHQELKDRFLREIKTSASLEHPNIAALRTAFQSGDMLLMVMEFVEGETLDQKLKAGPLPIDDSVRYTAQVLDALEYAHSRGVVHRDIKPQNVMITPKGTAKLLDFGIAKASTDKQLTMTGTTLGSLFYMSPEQIRGEHVDGRADLYSLGITLYELVTGKRPFGGDSGYAIMAEHLQKEPVPPVQLDSRVPQSLSTVILRSLAKKAGDRFQDAGEFRVALRNVAFGPSATLAAVEELTVPRTQSPHPQSPHPHSPTPAPNFPQTAPASPVAAPFVPQSTPPVAPQGTPIATPTPVPLAPTVAIPSAQPSAPYGQGAAYSRDPGFASAGAPSPKRRNTLALVMIPLILLLVLGAAGLVVAGSFLFGGGETTAASGKQPGFFDRIAGMFGARQAEETKQAEPEAGREAPAVDPASIAQATQSLPMESIDTGEAPITSRSASTVNQVESGSSAVPAASSVTSDGDASPKTRGKATPADPQSSMSAVTARETGSKGRETASAYPSSSSPSGEAYPSGQSGSQGGGYGSTYNSAPKADPRALEQSRDFFAKLGIRAGTIQESARTLIEQQAAVGVSLRADIRASLKRMEYLMDRAEAALNNQDLSSAKTQMELAEREIESLEKFFRI